MRKQATYQGDDLTLICYNLCHIDGHGDYEIFPDHPLNLNLFELVERFKELGYDMQGFNEKICLMKQGRMEITAFPEGRIIIEQLVPDDENLAIAMVADFIGARLL